MRAAYRAWEGEEQRREESVDHHVDHHYYLAPAPQIHGVFVAGTPGNSAQLRSAGAKPAPLHRTVSRARRAG